MKRPRNYNKFTKWVTAQGGSIPLSKRLNVLPHTVRVWMRGEGWPEIAKMKKIVRMSQGELSYSDLIHHCNPKG